jgi:two-component system C4-dicarboxylate transport sensor histidine kinase DctB
MSAGISHELNQPLAASRAYAENALAFLGRGQHERVEGNLTQITALADRMGRIIRHLRTYAREEVLELRPTAVCSAMHEALALLDQRIRSEGVTVFADLPATEMFVMGGDIRLQQVFVNILTNGIDAMEGRTEKALHIGLGLHSDSVRVRIRDTGQGIPPESMQRVFDPFFTTKEVGRGLGLGLSITYGIVKQFGGGIEIANDEQGGAVFLVSLKPCPDVEKAA